MMKDNRAYKEIPFKVEIVLWENQLTPGEIMNLSKNYSISLKRGLQGRALLRAGQRFLALGEVVEEQGDFSFKVISLLEDSENRGNMPHEDLFRDFRIAGLS